MRFSGVRGRVVWYSMTSFPGKSWVIGSTSTMGKQKSSAYQSGDWNGRLQTPCSACRSPLIPTFSDDRFDEKQ